MARCILSLPNGNADPERGFSINKSVLQIHGTSLEEDTIVALQLVKDYIVLNNGVDKIDIEESHIASCRNARTRYATILNEKKKVEMETKKELERRQKEKNSETEIEQLKRDRNIIKKEICNAESCKKDKSNQQGKDNFLPDQNQHGCKRKDKIIRGIKKIGQQNGKEEEAGLKHKLLRFL